MKSTHRRTEGDREVKRYFQAGSPPPPPPPPLARGRRGKNSTCLERSLLRPPTTSSLPHRGNFYSCPTAAASRVFSRIFFSFCLQILLFASSSLPLAPQRSGQQKPSQTILLSTSSCGVLLIQQFKNAVSPLCLGEKETLEIKSSSRLLGIC